MHTQPFTALTPDAVLDALDSIGLRSDGRLLALNSYENRVYQAGMEDGPPLVVKFYRPERWTDAEILEEHVFVAALAGRDTLEWMGRFIGRIHAVGALESYRHRPALDIQSFGVEPSAYLLVHDFIPAELIDVYRGVVAQALDGVRRCYDRACFGHPGAVKILRLHGDCHVGNVLWTDAGPHFV